MFGIPFALLNLLGQYCIVRDLIIQSKKNLLQTYREIYKGDCDPKLLRILISFKITLWIIFGTVMAFGKHSHKIEGLGAIGILIRIFLISAYPLHIVLWLCQCCAGIGRDRDREVEEDAKDKEEFQ